MRAQNDYEVNLSKLAGLLSHDHEKPTERELFIQKMLNSNEMSQKEVKFEEREDPGFFFESFHSQTN